MPTRTREDEFKAQRLSKMQKVVIIGAVVSAVLLFVYSFIFMSPFSDLYQIDGPFLYQKMANFGITESWIKEHYNFPTEAFYYSPFSGIEVGLNLAYFTSFARHELQAVNHWLFSLGFFGLLASLVPLVYFSQKRKIYYKSNYIAIPAVAAFNLYIGIHMFVQLVSSQTLVLSKTNEFILINAYQTYLNDNMATDIHEYFHTTDGNIMFVIGYLIALAIIAFAVLSCLVMFFKYRFQKKQGPVDLSKVHINE